MHCVRARARTAYWVRLVGCLQLFGCANESEQDSSKSDGPSILSGFNPPAAGVFWGESEGVPIDEFEPIRATDSQCGVTLITPNLSILNAHCLRPEIPGSELTWTHVGVEFGHELNKAITHVGQGKAAAFALAEHPQLRGGDLVVDNPAMPAHAAMMLAAGRKSYFLPQFFELHRQHRKLVGIRKQASDSERQKLKPAFETSLSRTVSLDLAFVWHQRLDCIAPVQLGAKDLQAEGALTITHGRELEPKYPKYHRKKHNLKYEAAERWPWDEPELHGESSALRYQSPDHVQICPGDSAAPVLVDEKLIALLAEPRSMQPTHGCDRHVVATDLRSGVVRAAIEHMQRLACQRLLAGKSEAGICKLPTPCGYDPEQWCEALLERLPE